MLEVRQLSKAFGSRKLLEGIDLSVRAGEMVAIMGESGAGKSTLLNLITGLDVPDRGSIIFEGRDLAAMDDDDRTLTRRRCMGFVFQAFHVLPYLSVSENVALPLALNDTAAEQRAERVMAALAAVGMRARTESSPRELSGGELQRVAIARALVHEPRLVLADEPTGNLDAESAAQVLALLRDHVHRSQSSAIVVTHSASAAAVADLVYVLERGALALRDRPRSL